MKSIFVAMALVLLAGGFPATVLAESASPVSATTDGAGADQRCERVSERIDQLLEKYKQKHDEHVAKYTGVAQRMEELLTKLDEGGYDTADIRAALAALEAARVSFKSNFENFRLAMEQAKQAACSTDQSPAEFTEQVRAARDELRAVRLEAVELRRILREDLQEALNTVREQVRTDREAGRESRSADRTETRTTTRTSTQQRGRTTNQ